MNWWPRRWQWPARHSGGDPIDHEEPLGQERKIAFLGYEQPPPGIGAVLEGDQAGAEFTALKATGLGSPAFHRSRVTHDTARVAGGNGARRHVVHHDRAGADHCPVADANAGKEGGIGADRSLVLDGRLQKARRVLFRARERSLVKVALGPTRTRFPNRTPSHSWTPLLTVTASPSTTSFSMNTRSQMLQSRPMRAPGSTCAKAQMRVPSPTWVDSQIPAGCTNTDSLSATLLLLAAGTTRNRPPDAMGQNDREWAFFGSDGVKSIKHLFEFIYT
jgi:hypothetical protein